MIPIVKKTPEEVLQQFGLDFKDELLPGETVSSHVIDDLGTGIITGSSHSGTSVLMTIEGGTVGQEVLVKVSVVGSQGTEESAIFPIQIISDADLFYNSQVVSIKDLVRYVAIEAPGCPNSLIEDAIRKTVIDFCQFTRIWTRDLTPIALVTNQREYPLVTPEQTDIAGIVHVHQSARPIFPFTCPVDQLDTTPQKYATHYGRKEPRHIQIHPLPSAEATDSIKVFASLKPAQNATVFAADLFRDWEEGLIAGAAYRVLIMNGKPWANSQLAAHKYEVFSRSRATAKITFKKRWVNKTSSAQFNGLGES